MVNTVTSPVSLDEQRRHEGEHADTSTDPRWARPGLAALLVVTATSWAVTLGSNGWANAFYSAAVQAGTKSWKAFLFGSSDGGNSITVDKPPASLWPMEISARIFGMNTWAILLPQVLLGLASVALLYVIVKRQFGSHICWLSTSYGSFAARQAGRSPESFYLALFRCEDKLRLS